MSPRIVAGTNTAKPIRISPLPKYPEIILALNLLGTTPPRFHWLIFVPEVGTTRDDVKAGTKIHAIDNGKQGDERRWFYDSVPFTLVTSASVAAAAILGQLPKDKSLEGLNDLLSKIPLEVPAVDRAREPTFSCRVWVREAVRRMHDNGYINCPDVDALEAEMWEHGKSATEKIEAETFSKATLFQPVSSRSV